MIILPNGTAAIEGDTLNEWIAQAGVLYDPKMALLLVSIIKRRGVTYAVDCGGHIGATTRPMLDVGCNVISFEANPDAAACLARNCPGATVVNKALGAKSGAKLMVKLPNACSNYLIDPPAGTAMDEPLCEVISLDDYYAGPGAFTPYPGLIKWDIEGSELAGLNGAERTITRCMPAMVMEINVEALKLQGAVPNDIYDWLIKHGYRWNIIEKDATFDSPHYNIEAMP